MTITLEFPGFLQLKDIRSGDTVPAGEGASVRTLLTELGMRPEHRQHVIPVVNGTEVRLNHQLNDGDHVFLYIPVGGG